MSKRETGSDLQRLKNLSKFWSERMAACETDAELAKVVFDRAKAAARRAQRSGQPRAMHELAELLAHWASEKERAEARRNSAA